MMAVHSSNIFMKLFSVLSVFVFCFGVTSAIMCYHCNSEFDPRCGDPFDSYSLGTVNCSMLNRLEHLPSLEATLCRKTYQKTYNTIRVVRGCGYITEEHDDKQCMRRSGTHDVSAIYCACTSDLCNSAPPSFQNPSNFYMMVLPSILVALKAIS